jgi:tetratricopeptide (TPR) repeat protein
MAVKCPKCSTENTSDSDFCKKCATPLPSTDDAQISVTQTLETPARRLALGSIFAERYEILEELGKGGMGEVYRVKDKTLDEEMALKVLKPEIAADKDIIERFKNELKLARKIAHRQVCKMYDLSEKEETPYITMEYVKGEDLKSFIRKKEKFKEEEVIAIAKQVCEGLAEAHELGVIHRDLKPQNIMIDEKSNAKVMDFGIASSVEAPGVTQSGVMIGTPDYMSPEQAEGEEADKRSDIYAFGVILYEMVTGSVPFKGDTAFSVALKHKTKLPSDPKKLNPDISDNLSRLILICMEKERERRYQTTESLLIDLRNIEEGLPLGTKIRPRRETFVAALIRKKLLLPAVVAAFAIIAVVIWQVLPQKKDVVIPSDEPSLAIMYFKNNTGDESLDHWKTAFADLLITDLAQSKYLRVLSEDRLYNILGDLNQLDARSYSSKTLKEVAVRGRANYVLQGNLTKAGENFRINITLQEAATGELMGSERVEGTGEKSFFTMVDDLTRRIKANFDLSSEEIASDLDKEVKNITTSFPEAFKYFAEGRKYHQSGDYKISIKLMEKALAIDPEFAMAYRAMAMSYSMLGYWGPERMKYLQKAFNLRNRLSDRESYIIQGDFFSLSEKTYDKAIEAYNKLLQLYPKDRLGNNSLSVLYSSLEHWDKNIERAEVLIQDGDNSVFPHSMKAIGYRGKGQYDKAIDVCKYYLNNFSDHELIRYHIVQSYICDGKFDFALIEVDKGLSLNPNYFLNMRVKGDIYHYQGDLFKAGQEYQKLLELDVNTGPFTGRDSLGALYLSKGKFEEAKEEAKKGIRLAEELNEKRWKAKFHLNQAYMYQRSGNPEKALRECKEALRSAEEAKSLERQRHALHLKGLAFLRMKAIEEAQKTADELEKMTENEMHKKTVRLHHHLMGRIELEKENFTKAIEYFNKALSLLSYQTIAGSDNHAMFTDSMASAYYKVRNLEKARGEYERITKLTTGRIFYGDIYAKAFYMLGKIHEQQGNTAKAIENYDKFLSIWKDADPGIAEVENARGRLARLKRKPARGVEPPTC